MFNEYLMNHLVKKDSGIIVTNTRIGDKSARISGGSYHVEDENYDSFLKLYFREIIQKGKFEFLTEKQLDNDGPILIDIDFRYEYSVSSRKHTKKNIDDIVLLYFNELGRMFQFEEGISIPVYIFEKPQVNMVEAKEITKDGIHIIIGLKVDRICQIILRKRVIEKIGGIWGDIPITNSWNDVFDEGITKGHVNWQLFGSRKPNNQGYKLTYMYNVNKDEEFVCTNGDPKEMETEENIVKLSARYNRHDFFFMDNIFLDEYELFKSGQIGPLIHKNEVKKFANTDCLKIQNKSDLCSAVSNFLTSLKADEYEMREAYEYTMELPSPYYESGSFTKWIRVGWALCNTSPRLFIVWVAMSAKQANFAYDITGLWDQWETFDVENKSGLTVRSILHWVKQCNPEGYERVAENSVDFHIDQTLSHTSLVGDKAGVVRGSGDFDIAKVLYHLYKDEYVCVSIKANIWYRYENHKWYEIDSGTTLRKCISEVLRNLYCRKAVRMTEIIARMNCDDEKAKLLKKRKDVILAVCDRLSRTSDKQNIMVEAKEQFYDGKFLDKLDQNPYLICFKNKVIDFKTKEVRNGKPDDYISKCTNIDYIELNDEHLKIKSEIDDFMEKLFPNPELLTYMWDHLSSTMLGICKEQTINMYIGIGQNGKSVLVNLMELVLGEYKGDVPLSLITQQRTKIGGLAPELVQLKGVRYAVIQEPSKGDRINEGIMKQLTGGDPVQARSPYMTQIITYIPHFKLVVCSNEFMDIQSQDHGTWRRIRVVDFESLFTDNPITTDSNKPHQYLLDRDIKEKFQSWKEVFASLLVANALKTGGSVKDCAKVLASSRIYREGQDSIAEFISCRICKHDKGLLSKSTVSENFREWFNVNYGGKAPNMKEFSSQADKILGQNRDGIWRGYQMKAVPPHLIENDIE